MYVCAGRADSQTRTGSCANLMGVWGLYNNKKNMKKGKGKGKEEKGKEEKGKEEKGKEEKEKGNFYKKNED